MKGLSSLFLLYASSVALAFLAGLLFRRMINAGWVDRSEEQLPILERGMGWRGLAIGVPLGAAMGALVYLFITWGRSLRLVDALEIMLISAVYTTASGVLAGVLLRRWRMEGFGQWFGFMLGSIVGIRAIVEIVLGR